MIGEEDVHLPQDLIFAAAAEDLPLGGGDSILLPKTYDIAWSLIPLLMLAIAITAAVVEARRGARWWEATLWFLVVLLIPALGLLAWLVLNGLRRSVDRRNDVSADHAPGH